MAANWALLRVGAVHPRVAQALVSCTGILAVALLYLVHPPWAAFLGGLLLCCTIGYLMSRQNFASVVVGRIAMVALFVFLLFEYFQALKRNPKAVPWTEIDPQFTIAFAILLACLLLGILASWVPPQRFMAFTFRIAPRCLFSSKHMTP